MVLSALGFSMMVLAGLIFLPPAWIAGIGASLILLHNLTDEIVPAQLGAFAPLWVFLHVRGPAEIAGLPFYVSYPLIPWVGVMALGYGIGPLFELERPRRRRLILLTGLGLIAAFLVLRATNVYGDASPWRHDVEGITSLLSFLNATKYPPSLLYLLMTLGPALVVLAALDRPPGPIAAALIPVGRTALFFYVLHLYLIHALALGLGASQRYGIGASATSTQNCPTATASPCPSSICCGWSSWCCSIRSASGTPA